MVIRSVLEESVFWRLETVKLEYLFIYFYLLVLHKDRLLIWNCERTNECHQRTLHPPVLCHTSPWRWPVVLFFCQNVWTRLNRKNDQIRKLYHNDRVKEWIRTESEQLSDGGEQQRWTDRQKWEVRGRAARMNVKRSTIDRVGYRFRIHGKRMKNATEVEGV